MIHVQLTGELATDEYGPCETYVERLVLSDGWARNAAEAHARLLTLLVTELYFELETLEGWVPVRSETVKSVAVWNAESSTSGSPSANSTLTMMTETKPIERKGLVPQRGDESSQPSTNSTKDGSRTSRWLSPVHV